MAAELEGQPADLPDLARTMIEAVAKFMGADSGLWRLDFTFDDGHLVKFTRQHGPAGARELAGFAAQNQAV